jgi:hypothetical protein
LSEFCTDEDIIDSLRLMFDYDEMHTVDWYTILGQVEELDDDYLLLRFRGRVFKIDRLTGSVSEEGDVE